MLEPGNPNYRLQDLEQRWAADPDSRIYQQLAEEYRKAGELEKAAKVLEEGLERRPRDIGGHVALGRCRLALGQNRAAVEALEQVVARDPAHHVANKLLIEAHLQAGDARRAGERLDTYELLNDRDPEIEHFTLRLRELRGQAAAPPTEADAGEPSAAENTQTTEEAGEETVDDTLPLTTSIETLAATAKDKTGFAAADPGMGESEPTEGSQMTDGTSPPEGDIFSLGSPPEPPSIEPPSIEPPPDESISESAHGDGEGPFRALLERPVGSSNGAQVVGEETPFPQVLSLPSSDVVSPVSPAVAEPEGEPSEPVSTSEEVVGEPAAETEESKSLETGIAPSLLRRKIDELAPTQPLPALDTEPRSGAAAPQPTEAATTEAADVVEAGEVASEDSGLEVGGLEDGGLEDSGLMETAPMLPAVDFEPEAADETAVPAEEEDEPRATVTLGNLYLKQGHFEEAAKIFEQVLARDPDNMAAQQGLLTARPAAEPTTPEPAAPEPAAPEPAAPEPAAPEPADGGHPASRAELSAARLLADRSLAGTIPEGKTARKVLVLSNYLKHLKTARERHDVH